METSKPNTQLPELETGISQLKLQESPFIPTPNDSKPKQSSKQQNPKGITNQTQTSKEAQPRQSLFMTKRMQILDIAASQDFSSNPTPSAGGDIKRDIQLLTSFKCCPRIHHGFQALYGMSLESASSLLSFLPHLHDVLDPIANVKISSLWQEQENTEAGGDLRTRCEELVVRMEELSQDKRGNSFEEGGSCGGFMLLRWLMLLGR